MKIFFLFILITFFLLQACNKSSDNPSASHLLTYKIVSNNYAPLSDIIYNDSSNKFIQSSAIDSVSWTKIFNVNAPFTAQLQVQGINNSTDTLNFTLEIDEDNIVKATQPQSIKPFNSFTAQVASTIQ